MLRPNPSANGGYLSVIVMVLIFALVLAMTAYEHRKSSLARHAAAAASTAPKSGSPGPSGQQKHIAP
ncbi:MULTISPECIES: hypothetical protein [unclassified Sphingomonas]|uniref:hypothetical protein n=1 Tax=unclassified Sphingomonas TaxID=196159 RepID=UPI002269B35D|nr:MULTISPECIES: hypothetical protein [unclassified Sphingomonas]